MNVEEVMDYFYERRRNNALFVYNYVHFLHVFNLHFQVL